jgi:alpha-glucosidase
MKTKNTYRFWLLCLLMVLFFGPDARAQKVLSLTSPDKNAKLKVHVDKKISYEFSFKDQTILLPSVIGMEFENIRIPGDSPRVISSKKREVNEPIHPLYGKFKRLQNNFNELKIDFRKNYSIIFRMYNKGLAYRFETRFPEEVKVITELSEYNFPLDPMAYMPLAESFRAEYEENYEHKLLSEFQDSVFAFTPVVLEYPGNIKLVLTESALLDYPAMYLEKNKNSSHGLNGKWPHYPVEVIRTGRSYDIPRRAGYIAKTSGTRSYPWRIAIFTDDEKDLLTNELVYLLAEPSKIEDTSWIKPGKVAWDWWYARNLSGVDFETGINTETYKYYIDFASRNNIEYINIDGGWYVDNDLSKMKPEIDIPYLVEYAKARNVDVILWVRHSHFSRDMEKLLDLYESWGIAGLKVDFLDRDDQLAIRFFKEIGEAAARHKMIINFHGCSKPAGIQRTYPNILNFEAVLGAEYSKWSDAAHPDHHVLLPFIRMLSGPMDYTPGAMRNATRENFRIIRNEPMGQGTRCHELAMYIVFDAPLVMISDAPTSYEKEPVMLDFFSKLETTWDTTVVIDALLGEYMITAKRKGEEWYIGALNNWTERDVEIDFSFLPEGDYNARVYKDGVNANKVASDYKVEDIKISAARVLKLTLASGGGGAIRLVPEN